MDAFDREALGSEAGRRNIDRMVEEPINSSNRVGYVWEDRVPVSMCQTTGATPHGIRIGAVYTPPELRRRGYASALVAAVSKAELDRGRHWCFLFTDLANPTSNRIYQAIGYRPIRTSADPFRPGLTRHAPRSPVLIGITGPIASGKSAIAQAVAHEVRRGGMRTAVIDLDLLYDMLDDRVGVGKRDEATWQIVRSAAGALSDALFAAGTEVVVVEGDLFTKERNEYLTALNESGGQLLRHPFGCPTRSAARRDRGPVAWHLPRCRLPARPLHRRGAQVK